MKKLLSNEMVVTRRQPPNHNNKLEIYEEKQFPVNSKGNRSHEQSPSIIIKITKSK